MWFIISSAAFCLQWLEVFSHSDLETFMSCVFNQGLVLPALSVGKISFANQKKFTERVAVLLREAGFHLPRGSPQSPARASAERGKVPLSQTSPRAAETEREAGICLLLSRANYLQRAAAPGGVCPPGVLPHAGSCHRDRDVWSPRSFWCQMSLGNYRNQTNSPKTFYSSQNSAEPWMASGSFCGSHSSFIGWGWVWACACLLADYFTESTSFCWKSNIFNFLPRAGGHFEGGSKPLGP